MLTNPVVISVLVVTILSLMRLNVILSLIVASVVGGFAAGFSITETMGILIDGMGGNAGTALSFLLLGFLAATIAKTGAAEVLALKIAQVIKGKGIVLIIILAIVASVAESVIPVHIAFIPILIPPLLPLMNKLKLDRRAAASAMTFGLKWPYIALPVGYGLIFHNIIADNMTLNGMDVSKNMVWQATWVAGLAMFVGFVISLFIFKKDRNYETVELQDHQQVDLTKKIVITPKHYAALVAGAVALAIQLMFNSMPLGAIAGIILMLVTRAIKWSDMEDVVQEGLKIMGMIAFIMFIASGYAAVMRATGGVDALVVAASGMMSNKFMGATVMIFLGLLITMGIGTSFGTVPIIATIYVPLCLTFGFSIKATILLIAVAAALGDAGSPASDVTLGPSSGLNADGQHDHIWDTCVPTFLCYNIPLIVFGIIGAVLL